MSPESVEVLYERFARRGDPEALAAVYDALASRLLAVALHLTRDSATAEDLVQATFVTAIERAASWKREMRVEPWLVGILGNHARNVGRSGARVPDARRVGEQMGEREGESPFEAAHSRELDEALEKALGELPEVFRPVLVLRLRHGLTSAEIAAALGRPPGTVRTQLARGLEHVRRALPVGLAGAFVALAARPARGLDVIRQVLLERAAAAQVVGAASVVTGVVLMKKLVAVVVVLALVVTGWVLWPDARAKSVEIALSGRAEESAQPGALDARPLAPSVGESAPRVGLAPESASKAAAKVAVPGGRISITARFAPDGRPAPAQVLVLGRHGPGGFPLDEIEFLTDGAGRVVLDEQAPGGVYVRGAQGGQTHGLLAAGTELELTLEIPSGVDVEGLVTDAHGRPIGGARVWVSDFAMFNLGHLAATTDEKGAFRLRSVGPQRWVAAKAKGCALSYLHEVRGHAGDVARLTIELDREGAQLSGRVLDRSGAPLAGALVLVGNEEVLPTRMLASGLSAPDSPPQLLRADEQGRFEVDGVPLGSCVVQARADGHCAGRAETIVAPQGGRIEILLDQGATLFGLASTLGGEALASVEISHGQPGKFAASFVYSNTRGNYELEGLPPGDVLVSATAIEHGNLEETLHLASGARREWNPRFPDAAVTSARIRGSVLDEHDTPLAGWGVIAQIARDPGAACVVSAPTDMHGSFVLAVQEQEAYRVFVQPPGEWTGFPRAVREGVRAGGEPLRIQIGDDARTSGRITGSVVDALGAPVSDAQVVLWHTGLGLWRTAAVGGPQARFEYLHVPPGEVEIEVRSETHPWSKVGRRMVRAGELLELGALRLADSGFVRGALRGVGDEALASVELLISSKEGRWNGTATIADHEFRSSALAPGDYRLLVKGAAILDQSREFQIAVGRETRLDLELTPAAARRVVCTLPELGARPEWITFLVVDSTGQSACMRNVRSGEGPTASADLALAPGSYTLRVLTRAGQGPSLAFTQSGSGLEEELRVTLGPVDAPR